jgi:hypothetical protein
MAAERRAAAGAGALAPWSIIGAILLLASGLYLHGLDAESLWIDEHYSVHDARHPELSVRPLYFWLLWAWMRLGEGEAWLRGLSVLFALGAVFLTWRLGRRLVDEATGCIAAAMLAVSPLFVNHAQEVRMYALSTLLGVAGTLALVHVLERPAWPRVLGWACLRLLVLLATPLNATLLLPDGVLLLWKLRERPRLLARVGIGLAVTAVLWLPVGWLLLRTSMPAFMAGWVAELPKPGPRELLQMLRTLTVLGDNVILWPQFDHLPAWLKLFYRYYLVVPLSLIGVAFLAMRRTPRIAWAALFAFLPPAGLLAISYAASSIFIPRYLLLCVPYLMVVLAAGLGSLWRWRAAAGAAVALVWAVAVGAGLWSYYTVTYRENWRAVWQAIRAEEEPGDVISLAIVYPRPELAASYYWDGAAPVEVLDEFHDRLHSRGEMGRVFERLWHERLARLDTRLWLVVFWGEHPIPREGIDRMVRTGVGGDLEIRGYPPFESLNGNLFLYRVTPRRAPAPRDAAPGPEPSGRGPARPGPRSS